MRILLESWGATDGILSRQNEKGENEKMRKSKKTRKKNKGEILKV